MDFTADTQRFAVNFRMADRRKHLPGVLILLIIALRQQRDR